MKKSWMATAALVIFTALAALYILRPQRSGAISTVAGNGTSDDRGNFFEVFREERAQTRQDEAQYLGEIIDSPASSAQAKRDAENAKFKLAKKMEDEFIIESMLLAKDCADAAVTISENGVNVVLSKLAISDEDAAKVLDIVCRQTGLSAQDVYIIASGG